MSRILLLLAFICLGNGLVYGQLDREMMERDRMRAQNVKVCTQYTHKYRKGVPNPDGYKTCETTYDKNGNTLRVVNYRANGSVSSKFFYTYDAQGRRLSYRKEEPDDSAKNMKTSYSQRFTYDAKGNMRTENGFDGHTRYRVTYNYLPNGRLADITRYDASNSESERWIYTYSGDRQIIRVTARNQSPYTVEKVLNPKGNLLEQVHKDSQGNETKRVEYKYDKAGRIQSEKVSYSGKERYTLSYVFGKKGELIKILQKDPDSKQYVNNDYEYDRSGNLISEKWRDASTDLVSKKDSEFDKGGDMVRVDSFYAPYKYRVMYTYTYEKY